MNAEGFKMAQSKKSGIANKLPGPPSPMRFISPHGKHVKKPGHNRGGGK
jgi:hypothetical protein